MHPPLYLGALFQAENSRLLHHLILLSVFPPTNMQGEGEESKLILKTHKERTFKSSLA